MKKWSLILALALAAALLTACGNGGPAATEAPAVTGESAPAPENTAAPEVTPTPEPPAETETPEITPAPEAGQPGETSGSSLEEKVTAAVPAVADLAWFSAEELEDMSGISPEDCEAFLFAQGNGMDGREILVIRAKDKDAADRAEAQMKEYLEQRREEHRDYAPDAYKLLSEAKVQRRGLLLVMVSGENAAAESAALLAGE